MLHYIKEGPFEFLTRKNYLILWHMVEAQSSLRSKSFHYIIMIMIIIIITITIKTYHMDILKYLIKFLHKKEEFNISAID